MSFCLIDEDIVHGIDWVHQSSVVGANQRLGCIHSIKTEITSNTVDILMKSPTDHL